MLAPSRLPALCAIAVAALALPATASAKKSSSPKLPAKFQKRFHVKSAVADPDHDGLTNLTEYRAHTNPKKADTDRDGTEDGSEDRDGDKLDNATEQRTANDPGNADSDGDGIKDGDENAGQVLSFEDGVLALRLASTGKVVTGRVDDGTNVECNATDDYENGYDDSAAEDTAGADDPFADDAGDDASFDDTDDAAASSNDSGDDATASAASLRTADDTSAGDAGDDEGTGDPCVDETMAPGAWVHEAELRAGDDGASVFDAVALVDDTL